MQRFEAMFQLCSDVFFLCCSKETRLAGKEWKLAWRLSKALCASRMMLFAVIPLLMNVVG